MVIKTVRTECTIQGYLVQIKIGNLISKKSNSSKAYQRYYYHLGLEQA